MIATVLQILGLLGIAVGAGLVFFPAGVIVFGVGLLISGLALERSR